jgi:hypothetical protein
MNSEGEDSNKRISHEKTKPEMLGNIATAAAWNSAVDSLFIATIASENKAATTTQCRTLKFLLFCGQKFKIISKFHLKTHKSSLQKRFALVKVDSKHHADNEN